MRSMSVSEYEEDSSYSNASTSSAEDEFYVSEEEEHTGDQSDEDKEVSGIQPYRFEPYASDGGSSDSESDKDSDEDGDPRVYRLNNNNWLVLRRIQGARFYIATLILHSVRCSCGNCVAMPTIRESVCYRETPETEEELEELDIPRNISCITEHPGFAGVCLDPWVLQTAAYHIRHSYGHGVIAQAGPSHEYIMFTAIN